MGLSEVRMQLSKATLMASFPFPTIRPVQEDALDKIASTMQAGKKFTILEMPTGSGKSPIAMAAALAAATLPKEGVFNPGAHITTSQIILQRQYMRDFEPIGLKEVKGKANYMCAHYEGGDVIDCAAASAIHGAEEQCGSCTYKIARQAYLNAPVGVTNFAYFTTTRKVGGEMVEKIMPSRQLLIVDECHNTEAELIGFGEVDISQYRLGLLDIDRPIVVNPEWSLAKKVQVSRDWMGITLLPQVKEKKNTLMSQALRAHDKGDQRNMIKLVKMAESMDQFKSKIDDFLDTAQEDPWVIYNTTSPRGQVEGLSLKPLYANRLAGEYLFAAGRHVLMLSATILGARVFARNLGISIDDLGFKRYNSDFPVENRLVKFDPIGSMSYKKIDTTLPTMVKRVHKACLEHPMEKGIIHTNSYKINKAVVDHLRDMGLGHRVLTHNSDKGSRDIAVAEHVESQEPTILISPSLTEGLDLSGDLSRWQVITKTPYPPLGDLWVKTRMEADPEWYAMKTALTIVQASGRSVRSKEDHAMTYILDSDFNRLLTQNGDLFPKWWKDALV